MQADLVDKDLLYLGDVVNTHTLSPDTVELINQRISNTILDYEEGILEYASDELDISNLTIEICNSGL